MTAGKHAVQTVDLTRVYNVRRQTDVVALKRVSLSIPYGEVHGLLGPNGAGKTTLVKILSTVLIPTAGTAEVCGYDVVTKPSAVRAKIGIVFGGDRGLYSRLSGRQNLEYWGALHRLPRSEIKVRACRLLDRVGLREAADRRVETYSRGMKQRLHLARGLIGGASVLFLDEPTTGMDPVAALDFRRLVAELREEGRTILLATHDMAEAEALCDRVTLIDQKVIAAESPKSLAALISNFRRIDVGCVDNDILGVVETLKGVARIERFSANARIYVEAHDAINSVLKVLVEHGVTEIQTSQHSLEEVYLNLVGRGQEAP
jgi:ABC-2 type transport system ATP-binding protein